MTTLNAHYEKLAAGYLFPEIARRAREFQAKNPGVSSMSLGIGNTTEPLTPAVIRGLHAGVDKLSRAETYTGYGDYEGDIRLRETLSTLYRERGAEIGTDEIFVSDGAKPDSGNIQSIFGDKNVVAVQDPAYPVYVDTNVIAGRTGPFDPRTRKYRRMVYMPCNESNGFFPDLPERKVDMIYLCSPNNPTGAVATREQLSRFVRYARENRSILIFDAAYSAFIRDPGLPRSVYEIKGARDCAIEIHSFSKTAGFTGVRLGWCVVPKSLVIGDSKPGRANTLWLRRQSTFFNGASNIAQEGGIAALTPEGRKECQGLVDFYMENARIIRETLSGMNLTVYGGMHAPYLWLKTPRKMKSWDFFDKLLSETHVIGTPGLGFGPSGEGFIRLSAFGHREDIRKAALSIEKNLKL